MCHTPQIYWAFLQYQPTTTRAQATGQKRCLANFFLAYCQIKTKLWLQTGLSIGLCKLHYGLLYPWLEHCNTMTALVSMRNVWKMLRKKSKKNWDWVLSYTVCDCHCISPACEDDIQCDIHLDRGHWGLSIVTTVYFLKFLGFGQACIKSFCRYADLSPQNLRKYRAWWNHW